MSLLPWCRFLGSPNSRFSAMQSIQPLQVKTYAYSVSCGQNNWIVIPVRFDSSVIRAVGLTISLGDIWSSAIGVAVSHALSSFAVHPSMWTTLFSCQRATGASEKRMWYVESVCTVKTSCQGLWLVVVAVVDRLIGQPIWLSLAQAHLEHLLRTNSAVAARVLR